MSKLNSTDGKMAYQLRARKRPVSYVDKTDWKVPRRPKQKKNEGNLYPIEVVEKDEENSRLVAYLFTVFIIALEF